MKHGFDKKYNLKQDALQGIYRQSEGIKLFFEKLFSGATNLFELFYTCQIYKLYGLQRLDLIKLITPVYYLNLDSFKCCCHADFVASSFFCIKVCFNEINLRKLKLDVLV